MTKKRENVREPVLPVVGYRILRAMDQEGNVFVEHFQEWGDRCLGSFDKCVAPSSSPRKVMSQGHVVTHMSGSLPCSEGWGHRATDCHSTDYYGAAPTGHDRSQQSLRLADAHSAETCDFLLKEEAKE